MLFNATAIVGRLYAPYRERLQKRLPVPFSGLLRITLGLRTESRRTTRSNQVTPHR